MRFWTARNTRWLRPIDEFCFAFHVSRPTCVDQSQNSRRQYGAVLPTVGGQSSQHNNGVWQTDGQTHRRTERTAISVSRAAQPQRYKSRLPRSVRCGCEAGGVRTLQSRRKLFAVYVRSAGNNISDDTRRNAFSGTSRGCFRVWRLWWWHGDYYSKLMTSMQSIAITGTVIAVVSVMVIVVLFVVDDSSSLTRRVRDDALVWTAVQCRADE